MVVLTSGFFNDLNQNRGKHTSLDIFQHTYITKEKIVFTQKSMIVQTVSAQRKPQLIQGNGFLYFFCMTYSFYVSVRLYWVKKNIS